MDSDERDTDDDDVSDSSEDVAAETFGDYCLLVDISMPSCGLLR